MSKDLLDQDYQSFSLSGLATYYNELAAHLSVKQIKKFADRKSAHRRIQGLIATAMSQIEVPEVEAPVVELPPLAEPKILLETKKEDDGKLTTKVTIPKAKSDKPKVARFNFNLESKSHHRKLREGTKRHQVFAMLSGTAGATFEECMEVTGWNRKDCYEGIRLLNTYCGFGMEHDLDSGVIRIK